MLESNRRTFDLDTARPISPGPIPGRADFALAHHLVVVRRWMWMLQIQFKNSRKSFADARASPDAVERICL